MAQKGKYVPVVKTSVVAAKLRQSVRVNYRLSADIYEAVRDAAYEQRVPMTDIVEAALRDYLNV